MCTCKANTYEASPKRKAKSQPLKAVKKKEIVARHDNSDSEKAKQVYMTTVRDTRQIKAIHQTNEL